ncbi:MAG: UDP-N-acetylmuramoyl-tripeptide--D-alanyl-D-alanine ligase [Ruminococcaceae bacterium]|nr:UDP-N-acetylmuramoyl-tripeptide--D-alanyl-D-alanine ligase [Oscillospiraceae bacterium]
MEYTLNQIAELSGGRLHPQSIKDRLFTAVNSDSRLIKGADTLFAALRGDNFDGHSFVADMCVEGGAIIDDESRFCPNSILVPSVKEALYRLAAYHRNKELTELKVLAITGSVGKTTAKNMAHLTMEASFNCYKSAGNRNSLTGLPMEVLNVPKSCTHAVLEAGMSDPGEIAKISALIKPAAAVITNIGHSHILAFGSREGICKEKLSILEGMETDCITLPDDPLLIKNCNTAGAVFCSVGDKSKEAYAENIEETAHGVEFTVCYGGKKTKIALPAYGIHNVMNALLVFVASCRMGADAEQSATALKDFATEGNRQNIRTTRGIKVIADCYNASPESMAAALGVLKTSGGKRFAVLGDMLELGEHAEKLHSLVGEKVPNSADVLICVGSDARYIAKSAAQKGMAEENIYLFPAAEYEKAAELLEKLIKAGDTVLFKASNRTNIRKVMEKTQL